MIDVADTVLSFDSAHDPLETNCEDRCGQLSDAIDDEVQIAFIQVQRDYYL